MEIWLRNYFCIVNKYNSKIITLLVMSSEYESITLSEVIHKKSKNAYSTQEYCDLYMTLYAVYAAVC